MTTQPEPHNWTDTGQHVLILKRINKKDRSTYNGFVYPEKGPVECLDWNPRQKCGGGLHGWPWAMGLGEGSDYDIIGDEWIVLAALPTDVVGNLDKGWKCKCRRADVIYSGPFAGAFNTISGGRHRLIEAMSKGGAPNVASGFYSTAASSGNYSKAASSGDYSKAASSGDYSTAASSGDSSKAASSGNSSKAASSGNYSKAASSGDSSKAASSGNYSTAASSGNYSKAASSGDYSTAASSGDSSTAASSGDYSKAAAQGKNTLACVAGEGCQVRVGHRGAFAIPFYTHKDGWRYLCGKVGEDGIEANTWYCVKNGKLTKVEE